MTVDVIVEVITEMVVEMMEEKKMEMIVMINVRDDDNM